MTSPALTQWTTGSHLAAMPSACPSLTQPIKAPSNPTRPHQLHPFQALQFQALSASPAAEPASSECRVSLVRGNCLKRSPLKKTARDGAYLVMKRRRPDSNQWCPCRHVGSSRKGHSDRYFWHPLSSCASISPIALNPVAKTPSSQLLA